MYEEYQKIIDEFRNNKEVKEFLSKFNKKMLIPRDFEESQTFIGDYRIKLFMIESGIPIGIIRPLDKHKRIIPAWKCKEISCFEYTPINSMEQYIKHLKKYNHSEIIINPNFLPIEKIQNITYCLSFICEDLIFDKATQNKLQIELMKNIPLKYENTMEIFNKYFTKEIQEKFIYQYKMKPERFYYLSGLNRLVEDKLPKKQVNKNQDREER